MVISLYKMKGNNMNVGLLIYLLIGYVLAFNTCCRAERIAERVKVRLSLFNTGFIILLFVCFWPAVKFVDMIGEAVANIAWKIESTKCTKENAHE